MNSQEILSDASEYRGQFRDAMSDCPDCETRFPLQILVAELLQKNQMLRLELQEVRSRLTLVYED